MPEPDAEQCLWLTTASIPVAFQPASAEVARKVFSGLASRCEGITVDP